MSSVLPPQARTQASAALGAVAVDGALHLQRCDACGSVQYPPRERCGNCLDDALVVAPVACGATVLATTELQHSLEPWFAARVPWTIASLQLDAGPIAIVHIEPRHGRVGARVRVATARDAGGAWCLVAFEHDDSDAAAALHRTLNTLGMNP